MIENVKVDLCTFTYRKLRNQYDRVILPIQNPGQGAGNAGRGAGGRGSEVDPQTQKSIHAYSVLNRFLQGFIDHVSVQRSQRLCAVGIVFE